MKQLTCEMCGSTDLLKQDGVFVCQTCGCKYSVEEAKKMMVEGTVEVSGTVRIDDSDELKKLYQAARNARATSDDASAIRHYESISAKDPNSWEASFYLVMLKTNSIKNGEIASTALGVVNCLPKVFELIHSTESSEEGKKSAVDEVIKECYTTAFYLTSASNSFYKTLTQGNGAMMLTGISGMIASASSSSKALSEDQQRCLYITEIMSACGDQIEKVFGLDDVDYLRCAIWSWKKVIEFDESFKAVHSLTSQNIFKPEYLQSLEAKISKYEQRLRSKEQAAREAIIAQKDAYWAGHKEEREQLEAEQQKLYMEKDAVEQQLRAFTEKGDNLQKQIEESEAAISALKSKQAGILFSASAKKALQAQIDEAERTKAKCKEALQREQEAHSEQIEQYYKRKDEITQRLAEIQAEFDKER